LEGCYSKSVSTGIDDIQTLDEDVLMEQFLRFDEDQVLNVEAEGIPESP
jgi:hypothetical protein